MRTFFFTLLSLFSFFSFLESAAAVDDFIAPSRITFNVSRGEFLSYDISYKSGMGGIYDLKTRMFRLLDDGKKEFLQEDLSWISADHVVWEFEEGQIKSIPLQINVPLDLADGDYYFGHFMKRRSEDVKTFELVSLMYLRVGPLPEMKIALKNTSWVLSDPTSPLPARYSGLQISAANTSGRFFSVTPHLRVISRDTGVVRKELAGVSVTLFPEFEKDFGFLNFSDADLVKSDDVHWVLQIVDESEKVISETKLEVPPDAVFIEQERTKSPFENIAIRKGLLYHPIFQVVAIVIGLTLLSLSFFMKK